MKTPGTRPAIGAAEDRLVAEIALDATEFASHQVECFIPRHFDEGLGAAALREGAGTMLEPALAYGGTGVRAGAPLRRTACAARSARDRDPSRSNADGWPCRPRRIRLRRRPNGPG